VVILVTIIPAAIAKIGINIGLVNSSLHAVADNRLGERIVGGQGREKEEEIHFLQHEN
jgi:uncharacterized membrane protein YccF (DUF307 family)